MNLFMRLKNRIMSKEATVGVIGLGYVGLPLAVEMARAGYKVIGIDLQEEKVSMLRNGQSYVNDVSSLEVQDVVNSLFHPSSDYSLVSQMDTISICVPTPLTKTKAPDISFILSAIIEIKKYIKKGTLIILESTTYPSTTDEVILAEMETLGFAVGEDFFLCFSPERVDPGNKLFNTKNTPKVIGGSTPRCVELAELLYGSVLDSIVRVSSTRVAETVKLLENTFRAVNIGLVNEMAMMCDRMGIDIWEVIDAAATKPFGFMKFLPGPGIGGHCIPLDPMYLSWKAKTYDFYNRFIELASDINGNMPRYTLSKISEVLNIKGKAINGSNILLLGMAYKKDINDIRESPGLELHRLLQERGANVRFHDPFVNQFVDDQDSVVHGVQLNEDMLERCDLVVLVTDHSCFDYDWIAKHAKLILDTRNAFASVEQPNIFKLGAPIKCTVQSALNEAAIGKETE